MLFRSVDAVVRRAAEQRAGFEGSDRIYVRHEKKERDVAVVFLVDISGSTGRQLDGGRRVFDVEKESLVLLCEALDAVGDQYSLYAYSGQGRGAVEIQTIKGFDERLGTTTAQRLGGLSPRQQNRDGAAIRHADAIGDVSSSQGQKRNGSPEYHVARCGQGTRVSAQS